MGCNFYHHSQLVPVMHAILLARMKPLESVIVDGDSNKATGGGEGRA